MSSFTYPAVGGSLYWKDPVATFASLPPTGLTGEARVTIDTQVVYVFDGTTWVSGEGSQVVGPASATDNAVTRFDGTSGKTIQNSTVIINDLGDTSGIRNLTATGTTTLATSLTGVTHTTSGVVSASSVVLTSEVSGILPVANGGTNSSTALNDNRVIQSSGGQIVEAAAITASRALASDANGIPVASATTAAELGYVSGVTGPIQTQLDAKEPAQSKGTISSTTTGLTVGNGSNSTVGPNVTVDVQTASGSQPGLLSSADWTTFNNKQTAGNYITALTGDVTASGPGSAAATIANLAVTNAKIANTTIDLTAKVTGVLPVANGGTNSSTSLNNNRVMQSSGGAVVEAAAITASRALASDANGIPVAATTTTTQLNYLSTTTGALSSPQGPNINMWLYVSQYGSDVTGDGTYNKPYATTAAARAVIAGNNSSTNRYGIHIRGTITEASIYLLPYVWYYGDTWGNSRLNASTDNAIKLDPTAFTSGNSRTGMTNVYMTGSTGFNFDFVAVTASGSHVIEIDNVGVNGAVVINSNNANQYFQWRGALTFSNFTCHGTLGIVTNSFFAGNVVLDNGTAGVVSSGINFIDCFVGGNLTLTGDGTHANLVQLNSTFISGNTTATGASSTLYVDSASLGLKSTVSVGSGATLVRLSDVYPIAYTPTTSGNWSSVPNNAQDAFDTLASTTAGHVTGQASSVDSEIALFSGTGGKTIKRATGTGFVKATSGVYSTSATVSLTADVAGTLPVANGGTNSATALNSGRYMISTAGAIVESSAAIATELNGVGGLSTTGLVARTGSGTYTPRTLTAGSTKIGITNGDGVAGAPTIDVNQGNLSLGSIGGTASLTTQVSGILPVANGGTNSSTSLNNNRVMQSSGGAVVEAAAITASRALISDANGIPTHSATTSTELGYVSGVTSAIQTQFNNIVAISQVVAVTTDVTLTNKAVHLVTTSSARSLTLPSPVSNATIVIKDATGSANTNNITIVRAASEKIETVAASFALTNNLGSWTFTSDGTDWFII